jgi:hypothetical protein
MYASTGLAQAAQGPVQGVTPVMGQAFESRQPLNRINRRPAIFHFLGLVSLALPETTTHQRSAGVSSRVSGR